MRKVDTVTVPEWGGRDAGKVFRIVEMPAARAEKWAMRAFLLIKGSGERIPDNVAGLGMVGVAIVGLNVFLQGTIRPEDLEPLMDEMFTCVTMVRDPQYPDVATALTELDVEEVQTRFWLRSEVLKLHTGFSAADALSTLISTVMASPAISATT